MTDVLIVGAGPAGSSLAIHLARQGRSVLLLDRAVFPREKACGEGVMPAGVAALERLDVHVAGAPFRGIRYHAFGRTVTGEFPHRARGLAIRRFHLDAALYTAAQAEPNVQAFSKASVEVPIIEDRTVRGVIADGHEYRAQLTVAADGANSRLRHKLGWDASIPTKRHGVRRHYRSYAPAEPWVDVFLEKDHETYITHLPNHELLVASLGNRHTEPIGLEPLDAPLGAAPLRVRAHKRVAPGCVLLGDAAGNCDPITGGGISQALLSSELLAKHLNRWPSTIETLQQFDREREAMLAKYRRLTAGVLTLTRHPELLKPALATLDRAPWLFSRLLGVAGGI